MKPRFIQLHPRTKSKLISMKRDAAADGADRVATRIHAVLLNHDNNTSGEIAKTLKVSLSGVSEWLKIVLNNDSEKGLSLLTEGRLNDGTTPSHCIVVSMVAPFIGPPLSE